MWSVFAPVAVQGAPKLRFTEPEPVMLFARLCLLIAWSFASVPETGTLSATVMTADGKKPREAALYITDVNLTVRVDPLGRFRVSLPAGDYDLIADAPGYETIRRTVEIAAGQTTTLELELFPSSLAFGEEIVVLGARKPRSTVDSEVPVDVVGNEALRATGQTETARALQMLVPSYNVSTSTISDGTDILRPATLRGLGPDQTLVLVNGKRRHPSALVHVNGSVGRGTAGVDLNAIPSSMVERIEVLRDGASAQYGSDAIAGVVNLVLHTDPGHTHVGLTGGSTFEGDGDNTQLSVGKGWSLPRNGYLYVGTAYRDRGPTNRAGPDPRQQYPLLPDGEPDPREARFDRLNHRYGDADSENLYLWTNLSVPFDQGELYAFGGVSLRDGESGGFYRRALDTRNRPEVHPDGFLPLIQTEVDDHSLSLGLRRLFGSMLLDASITHGGNSFDFGIANSVNASVGDGSMLDPELLGDLYAPLLAQAMRDPTRAEAGGLRFDQTTLNLDFNQPLGRQTDLAFGAELRRERYQILPGDLLSWADGGVPAQDGSRAAPGIQVFPGFRPENAVDEDRTAVGVYGDLSRRFGSGTTLSGALRFEDYEDFGNNLSGKVAFRTQPAPHLALRASLSSGFRAPSLHQAYFNNTSTQFVVSDENGELVPFEVGTFRQGHPVTDAFGIPALEEETSISAGLGFSWRPNRALLVTLDGFAIDIEDRIVLSGRFQASSDPDDPIADLLEPFAVSGAQFFLNAVDTETRGLDAVVAWNVPLVSSDRMAITAAFNWNETEVVAINAPPLLDIDTLFDRVEVERLETAQPRVAGNVGLRYDHRHWRSNLRFNYFGSVKTVESASDPSRDQVHGGEWLTDLDVGYELTRSFSVSVGAQNLFDVTPDAQIAANSFEGIFPYSRRTAPFGFNGGYYYLRFDVDL